MHILQAISDSALSAWVRESPSLFAYPMFILLHTVGLAILVGLSSVLALLILGSAPRPVLTASRAMFPYIWAGFGINAVSGLVLIAADAPTMAMNQVMWIKFGFVIAAIVILRRVQRFISADTRVARSHAIAGSGKGLATATLLCWVGAIVTGRLTAYIGPFAGLLTE